MSNNSNASHLECQSLRRGGGTPLSRNTLEQPEFILETKHIVMWKLTVLCATTDFEQTINHHYPLKYRIEQALLAWKPGLSTCLDCCMCAGTHKPDTALFHSQWLTALET